jgi:hypothetical protein
MSIQSHTIPTSILIHTGSGYLDLKAICLKITLGFNGKKWRTGAIRSAVFTPCDQGGLIKDYDNNWNELKGAIYGHGDNGDYLVHFQTYTICFLLNGYKVPETSTKPTEIDCRFYKEEEEEEKKKKRKWPAWGRTLKKMLKQ